MRPPSAWELCRHRTRISSFSPDLDAAVNLLHLVDVSASVAGPLTTAPLMMSKREPWHWHMSVVPVSRPPDSGQARSAQVQRSSNA